MARRISQSQFKSKLRQAAQKQKQAIDRYNGAARQYNQHVKRAVNEYNREVRAHNARVRANRVRLNRELAKLRHSEPLSRYVVLRASTESLSMAYVELDQRTSDCSDATLGRIVDFAENEAANSVELMNSLRGEPVDSAPEDADASSSLVESLNSLSADLASRWTGAVFALDSRNPDAARHFCSSSREIFTQILQSQAPDELVKTLLPDCELHDGRPTRRARIACMLRRKDIAENALEDFVEADMQNVVELFRVLNDGTHGDAGKFSLQQLRSIKKRVEAGLEFLLMAVA